jgi:cellulose synthase (UDP-forming)
LFIAEVGFVAATVVRQTGRFLAVHFDLPPCIERDLLVRKLFTAGLNAITVNASAFSSTGAMLKSIWAVGTSRADLELAVQVLPTVPTEKLPTESLVIPPQSEPKRLAKIAAERQSIAA